jgi:hypothetical protein
MFHQVPSTIIEMFSFSGSDSLHEDNSSSSHDRSQGDPLDASEIVTASKEDGGLTALVLPNNIMPGVSNSDSHDSHDLIFIDSPQYPPAESQTTVQNPHAAGESTLHIIQEKHQIETTSENHHGEDQSHGFGETVRAVESSTTMREQGSGMGGSNTALTFPELDIRSVSNIDSSENHDLTHIDLAQFLPAESRTTGHDGDLLKDLTGHEGVEDHTVEITSDTELVASHKDHVLGIDSIDSPSSQGEDRHDLAVTDYIKSGMPTEIIEIHHFQNDEAGHDINPAITTSLLEENNTPPHETPPRIIAHIETTTTQEGSTGPLIESLLERLDNLTKKVVELEQKVSTGKNHISNLVSQI